jgi:hypothetical protein
MSAGEPPDTAGKVPQPDDEQSGTPEARRTRPPIASRTWKTSRERAAVLRAGILSILTVLAIAVAASLFWYSASQTLSSVSQRLTSEAQLAGRRVTDNSSREWSARESKEDLQRRLDTARVSTPRDDSTLRSLQQQIDRRELELDIIARQREVLSEQYDDARQNLASFNRAQEQQRVRSLAFSAVATITGVGLLLALAYFRSEKRREFENYKIILELDTEIGGDGDDFTLPALWLANRDQLKSYHRLVLNYANSTRRTTLIALSFGFAFLVVAGALAPFARTASAAVATSIAATAGAGVTAFVAQAVLRNADSSSKELLAFFSHPLEVEKMLAAERLINGMPAGAQDEAKLLVIQALTNSTPQAGSDGDALIRAVRQVLGKE